MGLLVAAVIMFVISIGMFAQKASYSGREVPRAVAIVPLFIGIVLVLASMVAIIPAGHVGVPILFGKVQDNPLTEGLHLINPLLEVQNMSVRTEAYTMSSVSREGQLRGDDSITVLSKDGLRMPPAPAPIRRLTLRLWHSGQVLTGLAVIGWNFSKLCPQASHS